MKNIKNTQQIKLEAVIQRCSVNKVFLKVLQNSQANTCTRVSLLTKLRPQACEYVKKETLAQVFSCEIFVVYKSTFFHRTPLAAASVKYNFMLK